MKIKQCPEYNPPFECPRCGHYCREWVGLTDDELEELEVSSVDRKWGHLDASLLSRSIEAKLKEKNNG